MKQKYNLIYFILVIIQLYHINSYHCGFGKLGHRKAISLKMESKRKLDSTYDSIRIHIDLTQLKAQGISSSKYSVVEYALNKAAEDYQKILKVNRLDKFKVSSSKLSDFKESCMLSSYDSQITSQGLDADLVIFPYVSSELGSGVIAASKSCVTHTTTGRPVAGYIWINPSYIDSGGNAKLSLKNTIFHEMAHILVFDPELFIRFGKIGTTSLNGVEYYYIGSSKVVSYAKKHFGCDSLKGVLLENQGSSGSANAHWEARIMLGDYMISTNYLENAISEITLGLFEDSGWYGVNYYTGGLFRFGKGQGCSFIQNKCIVKGDTNFHNEFCLSQQGPRCTNSHLFYGTCYLGNFHSGIPSEFQYFGSSVFGGFKAADYCPVGYGGSSASYTSLYSTSCVSGNAQYSDAKLGETIGSNSICVLSTLRSKNYLDQLNDFTSVRAICHEMTCDFTNEQTIFTILGQNVECPKKGGLISVEGFDGQLECPEFNLVCTSQNYCTDISSCIDNGVTAEESTFTFNYSPGSKFQEDTTYNIESEVSDSSSSPKVKSICNISILLLAIILIIY